MIENLEYFLKSDKQYYSLHNSLYLDKDEVKSIIEEIKKFHIKVELGEKISPLEKLALRMLFTR